jgi:hypothetical protein
MAGGPDGRRGLRSCQVPLLGGALRTEACAVALEAQELPGPLSPGVSAVCACTSRARLRGQAPGAALPGAPLHRWPPLRRVRRQGQGQRQQGRGPGSQSLGGGCSGPGLWPARLVWVGHSVAWPALASCSPAAAGPLTRPAAGPSLLGSMDCFVPLSAMAPRLSTSSPPNWTTRRCAPTGATPPESGSTRPHSVRARRGRDGLTQVGLSPHWGHTGVKQVRSS